MRSKLTHIRIILVEIILVEIGRIRHLIGRLRFRPGHEHAFLAVLGPLELRMRLDERTKLIRTQQTIQTLLDGSWILCAGRTPASFFRLVAVLRYSARMCVQG